MALFLRGAAAGRLRRDADREGQDFAAPVWSIGRRPTRTATVTSAVRKVVGMAGRAVDAQPYRLHLP